MKTKVIISLLLGFFFCNQAQAQLTKVRTSEDGRLWSENCFMKDSKFSIVRGRSYQSSYRDDTEIEIYNEDLSLYKKIQVEDLMPQATRFREIEFPNRGINRRYITQTLFNDDDFFEFIVTGENFFAIVNENGTVLYKEEGRAYDITVLEASSLIYLSMGNGDGNVMYKITKDASNISAPLLAKTSSYPNPASSYINIDYDLQGAKEGLLQVFDMQGKLVAKENIKEDNGSFRLETAAFQSGTYIVSISSAGKQLSSEKIIIE